jgi:NADH:ubiquinone oxidoreductase subunit 2 (subunit N)
VAWLDSIWDGLNTLIRPLGGALLALAVVDAGDPVWQVIVFLLGGGAAFASHATKATTRAAVNTSPEPFSNVVLSTAEDVATGGLLAMAFANPIAAALIALVLLGLTIYGLFAARRVLKRFLDPEPALPEKAEG